MTYRQVKATEIVWSDDGIHTAEKAVHVNGEKMENIGERDVQNH